MKRLLLAVALLAAGCTPKPRALDEIRARGKLRVVTLNNPTSFYYGTHGAEGLEFELTRAFAAVVSALWRRSNSSAFWASSSCVWRV